MSSRALPWIVAGLVAGALALELAAPPSTPAAAGSAPAAAGPAPSPAREVPAVISPAHRERERTSVGAVASRPVGPAVASDDELTTYHFELSVVDADDQPLAEAAVFLSPWPSALNFVGWTDVRGRLRVDWRARVESMRVAYTAAHARFGAASIRLCELTGRPFAAAVQLREERRPSRLPRDEQAPDPRANAGPEPLVSAQARPLLELVERRPAWLDPEGLLRFRSAVSRLPGEAVAAPQGWKLPDRPAATRPWTEDEVQVHVAGVVRDPDATPIPGARVRATDPERGFALSTRSDERGEFALGPLPRGSVHLSVGGGDRGRYETDLGCGIENFQSLHPSLQRGRVLEGRCLDPDGRPLAGHRVELSTAGARQPWADVAWTDTRGRFAVPNAPTTMLGLDLFAPGSAVALPFASLRGIWAEPGLTFDSERRVGEEGRVLFVLLDGRRGVPADAELLLVPERGDRAARVVLEATAALQELARVPAGRYGLWFHARGERSFAWPSAIQVEPGGELDLGTAQFAEHGELAVETSSLLGVSEFRIETRSGAVDLVAGVFRARGRWRVELPAGRYVLCIRTGPLTHEEEFEVHPGKTSLLRAGRP